METAMEEVEQSAAGDVAAPGAPQPETSVTSAPAPEEDVIILVTEPGTQL